MFCNEHTLIMYLKKIFKRKFEEVLNDENNEFNIIESENCLFETNDKLNF